MAIIWDDIEADPKYEAFLKALETLKASANPDEMLPESEVPARMMVQDYILAEEGQPRDHAEAAITGIITANLDQAGLPSEEGRAFELVANELRQGNLRGYNRVKLGLQEPDTDALPEDLRPENLVLDPKLQQIFEAEGVELNENQQKSFAEWALPILKPDVALTLGDGFSPPAQLYKDALIKIESQETGLPAALDTRKLAEEITLATLQLRSQSFLEEQGLNRDNAVMVHALALNSGRLNHWIEAYNRHALHNGLFDLETNSLYEADLFGMEKQNGARYTESLARQDFCRTVWRQAYGMEPAEKETNWAEIAIAMRETADQLHRNDPGASAADDAGPTQPKTGPKPPGGNILGGGRPGFLTRLTNPSNSAGNERF